MKKQRKKRTKRVISMLLVLTMIVQVFGIHVVYAKKDTPSISEPYHYLEAATMPDEILSVDTFYVGTTSADLDETSEKPYLLKFGRGGNCLSEASVVLKISDATVNNRRGKVCQEKKKN